MKKLISILLSLMLVCSVLSTEVIAAEETDTTSEEAIVSAEEEETESTSTYSMTVDEDGNILSEESDDTDEDKDTDDADDASDDADDADAADAESSSSAGETGTTDNTSAAVSADTGKETAAASSAAASVSTLSDTASNTTSSDKSTSSDSSETSETEKEGETETTYTLSFKITTTTDSDGYITKIKVTKPKLTTKVVNTETGKTISKKSKTYSLTVKASEPSAGWTKATTKSTYYVVTAKSKYLQAVKITPSKNLKTAMKKAGVTFYYRAKTEAFGTLGWAKAGKKAGTTGNSTPMTKLTLKIVNTNDASSLDTSDCYINKPVVQYKTKVTGASSWSSAKTNGSTSGNKSSSLGKLAIKLANEYSFSGSIKYSIRTSSTDSDSKWSAYKKNYSAVGSGKNKIKAVKIKLTGDMADNYDVYYRVYVKGYGWLGWAKNGQKAGTKNSSSYYITGIQVKLVVKGNSAPGSTSNRYLNAKSSAKLKMISKAQSFSSTSKYLILVNRSACRVGIFTGSKGNWKLKYYWSCCVGKASTPTISGSYTVGIKRYSFGESKGYSCYYATQISGNYLFHSVLYYPYSNTIKDGTMGKAVSHGCVRLTKSHAYWIYKNIPRGTKVYIY